MSVYTRLTKEELEQLLYLYDIGEYISVEGINEGITNSNYYLTTSKNKFILTIFEEPNLDLYYAIDLMHMLSANKINCPTPLKTKEGLSVINVKNKPCSIFTLLPGKTISKNTSQKLFFDEDYKFLLNENNLFYYEDKINGIKLPKPNVNGQFQIENILDFAHI